MRMRNEIMIAYSFQRGLWYLAVVREEKQNLNRAVAQQSYERIKSYFKK
jgi:hypothetical protein